MTGDPYADWIETLCAFYRKLPGKITAMTLPQFRAACDAYNAHVTAHAGASDD